MIREALKILAALLENCASAINERLDPPLPMVSLEAIEEMRWLVILERSRELDERIAQWAWMEANGPELMLFPANDETITRH